MVLLVALIFAVVHYSLLLFEPPYGFAENVSKREAEQTSEGLEMIAVRMQQLSQRLDKIPEPPAMNQTIEIPDWGPKPSAPQKEASSKNSGKDDPFPERKEK